MLRTLIAATVMLVLGALFYITTSQEPDRVVAIQKGPTQVYVPAIHRKSVTANEKHSIDLSSQAN